MILFAVVIAVVDAVVEVRDKLEGSGMGGAWHVISASMSIPPARVLDVDETAHGSLE